MSVQPKQLMKPGLTDHERRVKAMMLGFGQDCPENPTVGDEKTRISRARLKLEETLEFIEAAGLELTVYAGGFDSVLVPVTDPFGDKFGQFQIQTNRKGKQPDLVEMIDALVDDSVVNTGSFVAFGVQMTPMLEAVDENNLMKIANGKLDEHGKFKKAPDHPKVNLLFVLALQGYDEANDRNLDSYRPPAERIDGPSSFTVPRVSATPLDLAMARETGRTSCDIPNEAAVSRANSDSEPAVAVRELDDAADAGRLVSRNKVRKSEFSQDCLVYSGMLVDVIILAVREGAFPLAEKLLRDGLAEAGYQKEIEINANALHLTGPGESGERGIRFCYRRLA